MCFLILVGLLWFVITSIFLGNINFNLKLSINFIDSPRAKLYTGI